MGSIPVAGAKKDLTTFVGRSFFISNTFNTSSKFTLNWVRISTKALSARKHKRGGNSSFHEPSRSLRVPKKDLTTFVVRSFFIRNTFNTYSNLFAKSTILRQNMHIC